MATHRSYVLSFTVLILLLTIEVSFIRSILFNCWIVLASIFFLVVKRKYSSCLLILLLPILPACATYWSVIVHGEDQYSAILLATRTYSFVALGILFSFGLDLEELLLVLEQKGVPPNFVYGLMTVINAADLLKNEVYDLREAALFKGKKFHFWSGLLYFKTMVLAFNWQKAYVEAMHAHGYDENALRSHYRNFQESRLAMFTSSLFFLGSNFVLFV